MAGTQLPRASQREETPGPLPVASPGAQTRPRVPIAKINLSTSYDMNELCDKTPGARRGSSLWFVLCAAARTRRFGLPVAATFLVSFFFSFLFFLSYLFFFFALPLAGWPLAPSVRPSRPAPLRPQSQTAQAARHGAPRRWAGGSRSTKEEAPTLQHG